MADLLDTFFFSRLCFGGLEMCLLIAYMDGDSPSPYIFYLKHVLFEIQEETDTEGFDNAGEG